MGTVLCMASCSSSEIVKAMQDAGAGQDGEAYTVAIRFDPNGGWLKGRGGVSIVEVYNAENGDFKIPDPADEAKRGKDGLLRASKTDYFLAGWYREREEIGVDANGDPVYSYSGRWDFATDVVKVDPNKTYDPEEPVVTLYAAWVPYMTYEFYAIDAEGNSSLIESKKLITMQLPEWTPSGGAMDYNQFAERDGMTFEAAYFDAEKTQPIANGTKINAMDYVDPETGLSSTSTIRIYSTWLDGEWFRIHTADQFLKNFRSNGHYIICADLDFQGKRWQTGDRLTSCNEFNGTICAEEGKTYKFANITASQTGLSNKTQWGLFGALGEDAVIRNISFENASLEINTSLKCDGFTYFGLLAGKNNGAALENVTVSGTLKFTGTYNPMNLNGDKCTFGLLFGMGDGSAIDRSGITYTADDKLGVSLTLDESTGSFTVTDAN